MATTRLQNSIQQKYRPDLFGQSLVLGAHSQSIVALRWVSSLWTGCLDNPVKSSKQLLNVPTARFVPER